MSNPTPRSVLGTDEPQHRLARYDAGAELGSGTRDHSRTTLEPYAMGLRARRALRALIVALSPPEPAPSPERMLDSLETGARRLLRAMPAPVARALWLLLVVIDYLPTWTARERRPLHALPATRAATWIAKLGASRWGTLRLAVGALRGLALSVYFDQPEVHAALGYAPEPYIAERRAQRLALLCRGSSHPTPTLESA